MSPRTLYEDVYEPRSVAAIAGYRGHIPHLKAENIHAVPFRESKLHARSESMPPRTSTKKSGAIAGYGGFVPGSVAFERSAMVWKEQTKEHHLAWDTRKSFDDKSPSNWTEKKEVALIAPLFQFRPKRTDNQDLFSARHLKYFKEFPVTRSEVYLKGIPRMHDPREFSYQPRDITSRYLKPAGAKAIDRVSELRRQRDWYTHYAGGNRESTFCWKKDKPF